MQPALSDPLLVYLAHGRGVEGVFSDPRIAVGEEITLGGVVALVVAEVTHGMEVIA